MWTELHLPCPCGLSSDAYCEDTTGGFCFSCSKRFNNEGQNNLDNNTNHTYEYISWRKIKKTTFEKFKSPAKIATDGVPLAIAFPYGEKGSKVRLIKEKSFYSHGDMHGPDLFGKDIFPAGSAGAIIITEGELDALSAWQMTSIPAVSVKSAQGAAKDCGENLDYLNSFNKIYICFDNDEPGQNATRKVAALLGDKAYHIKLSGKDKDANDFLQRGAEEEFKNIIFYSRRFIPDEVVSSYNEIDKLLREAKKAPVVSYPFPKLQEATYGIHRGIVLVTAQEGQGKTEVIRAIEAHILKTTDLNIGIIHLEESKQRTIQGLAGYELSQPCHLPDARATVDDVVKAYRSITKRDERVYLVNHFDNDDPNAALDLIRFLVAKCGCKVIFLDHITQIVSALEEKDERKKLDWFSTKLARMTQELDFACVLVSHVNDEGQTRGSRYIGKVAKVRIDLSRDHLNVDEEIRNTTTTTLSKNRDGSKTGPSSVLRFDPDTFIIKEI